MNVSRPKKYFLSYILWQAIITIIILLLGYVIYFNIPDIGIIDIIEKYKKEYNETHDHIMSILNVLNALMNTSSKFIQFIKILLAIIFTIVLLVIQYLMYKQYSFQETIIQNSNEIGELANTIAGIETTLETHFEEYKIVKEYSRLHNSLLHHNFEEALQYDIERIGELQENDIYQSTVVLEEKYLDIISNNNLLQKYINIIQEKAERGIVVERIFIYSSNIGENLYDHLDGLVASDINVYLFKKDEIDKKYTQLSNNFIMINEKEVAFAYPFSGEFKFAINLLESDEREVKRHINKYKEYFTFMKEKSTKYNKKKV